MALRDRIQDFGQYIPGAAKDRWRAWADRLDGEGNTLGEIFPEPPYEHLLEDGFDPMAVACLHAMRDAIPARPAKSWKVRAWEANARQLARVCSAMMSASAEGVAGAMDFLEHNRDALRIFGYKARLYEALGHGRSLRNYEVRPWVPSFYGAPADPDRFILVRGRMLVADGSLEKLARFIAAELDAASRPAEARARTDDLRLRYLDRLSSGKFDSAGRCQVTAKVGRNFVDLPGAVYESVAEGRRAVKEDRARLEQILARLRDVPSERYPRNAPRVGPARRAGDLSPEAFSAILPMRGVQFGNSMELHRRQSELGQAHDAFLDMAEVLGRTPGEMTLGRDLALAFGARGKGGRNAAKAHFEKGERVINMTRREGAGSLGHEWFHAFDLAEGRKAGRNGYASLAAGTPLHGMIRRIIAETEVSGRASRLDEVRAKPYWGETIEVAARSFEAWLKLRLHMAGIRNDYLVNFREKEDFDLLDLADLTGAPSRYPYPTMEELPAVDRAFSAVFGCEPATPGQVAAHDRDRHLIMAMDSARNTVEPSVEPDAEPDAPGEDAELD